MHVFEVRGVRIERTSAQSFKDEFTGKDWREKLVEGFDHMLSIHKEKPMRPKERHAFYKWMADAIK